MPRRLVTFVVFAAVCGSVLLSAQGRVKQYGRAIVQFRNEDVLALASYEYSQRYHDEAWLLIEFAVQATERIVMDRKELSLMGPDERTYSVAAQREFLEDHEVLRPLLQNALVWRRPLEPYFVARPAKRTIQFFSTPGRVVHDSVVTNLDEVATGDLFFKSPDGKWAAGTYRLVLNHRRARAELPITLQ